MLKRLLGAALAALLLLPIQLGAAVLTVNDTADTGVEMTLTAAGVSGDSFANPDDHRTIFVVTKGGSGSVTVTITPATTQVLVPGVGLLDNPNGGGSVSAGTTKIFGPFPTSFNDSNGRVAVTYSTTTSVTVNPFRVPRQ